jgi:hypothetical protein
LSHRPAFQWFFSFLFFLFFFWTKSRVLNQKEEENRVSFIKVFEAILASWSPLDKEMPFIPFATFTLWSCSHPIHL